VRDSFNTMTENLSNQYNNFKEDVFDPLRNNDPTQNNTNLQKSIKDIVDL
jgi:hypothetical protein